MILTENKNEVVTNVETSGAFRIRASRKAFEILSSGLYSDKVKAIVRELSTNAADAHIAAGKKGVPFDVHLPNGFEPWFSVTDYGTGLSDADINSIYTTYFESNKTDSNDFTGALGLGSKSPFSYTDSFTVESRHNGTLRVYNAYLNEDGLPTIAKMSEAATKEPNGLTVKFPVKSGDFHAFREKAQNTLVWFKTKPNVKGVAGFTFEEFSYLLKTDKFAVHKKKTGRSVVIMGNVAYPVGGYDFLSGYDDATNKMHNLLDWGVEIYVGIGDVDIAASREKLGYDKRTVRFLKEKLTEALKDMQTKVTENIAAKPTLWEAREALHEVRSSFSGFNFNATWGGVEITDMVKIKEYKTKVIETDTLGVETEKEVYKPEAVIFALRTKNRGNGMAISKDRADSVIADGSKYFIQDERGGLAAVRRYLEDKGHNARVYFIQESTDEFLKSSGLASVAVKTSTLPKAERNKTARSSSTKAKVYEFYPQGNFTGMATTSGGFWKPAEVEVEDGGVYVEISYFNYKDRNGKTVTPDRLNSPLANLIRLGKTVKIYGIRPSDKALFDNSGGEWVEFHDYVQECVKEFQTTYQEQADLAAQHTDVTSSSYDGRFPFQSFDTPKVMPDSDFWRAVEFAAKCRNADTPKVLSYKELRSWLQLPKIGQGGELVKTHEAIMKKYPMLQFCSRYGIYGENVQTVIDYVALVDAK